MFDIHITDEVADYSKELTKRANFGQRGRFDGSPGQQLAGVAGENMIRKLLGVPLIEGAGFNGGIDIVINGKKVDVKTSQRKCPPQQHHKNNVVGSQVKYKSDTYLFLSLNGRTITVCGWIPKSMFLEKATFTPKGGLRYRDDGTSFPAGADLYDLPNIEIYNLDSIEEIKAIGLEWVKATHGTCNTCKHYGWVGLKKWCGAWQTEIDDDQWPTGCDQYLDAYAKRWVHTGGKTIEL